MKHKRKLHPRYHRFFLPFHLITVIVVAITFGFHLNVFASNDIKTISIVPAPNENDEAPTGFSFRGKAGTVFKGKAIISNPNAITAYATVYGSDTETTQTGAIAFVAQGREQKETGKWLEVLQPYFALAPEEKRIIDFNIRIPEYAAPGDYVGGIIAQGIPRPNRKAQSSQPSASNEDEDSLQGFVSVQTRIGSFVYITIDGEKFLKSIMNNFRIEAAGDGTLVFIADIENKGNTKFAVTGDFTLMNSKDEKIGEAQDVSFSSDIYPGKSAASRFNLPWNKKDLPYDKYTVIAKINDTVSTKEGKATFDVIKPKEEKAWVLSGKNALLLYSGGGIIVFLLILNLFLILRRRGNSPSGRNTPPASPPIQ